jgi:hypothetical protein
MSKLRNFTILSLLLFASVAHAQAVSDPLQYTLAPETPGPNAPVIIRVDGVGNFLGNAMVTWTKDGVVALRGIGERTFSFTTGALGTRTSIHISIQSDTNGSFVKDFVFSPSLVNLVWEADTTVPPFYRGKALYSAGSPLKIVAFPSIFFGGSQIAPQALSYQWSRNNEPVPEASGLGRSSYTLGGDQLELGESIGVDLSYGNTKVAHGEIVVPAANPQVLLYYRDALGGTRWGQALPATIQLNASEITVQAEPYYFSAASKKAGGLAYSWTLDGNDIHGPDSGRGILTLRQAGAGQGSAALAVSVDNQDTSAFIQSARAALQMIFGQQNSSVFSSFFGL